MDQRNKMKAVAWWTGFSDRGAATSYISPHLLVNPEAFLLCRLAFKRQTRLSKRTGRAGVGFELCKRRNRLTKDF